MKSSSTQPNSKSETDVTPEQILAAPPRGLSQQQRQFYFANGYVLLEKIVPTEWMDRLTHATREMVEQSRTIKESNDVFDLEPDHTAEHPCLRRLSSPVVHHPDYWEFAADSIAVDIAADLVGPDVKFHHTHNPLHTEFSGQIVHGEPTKFAHHDPRPCQVPPDWSDGYTSIYAVQQKE
ncbi:phytanoyl-CoA dioxygenase family protein [Pirellulales bacterium]|nr:phytanoyl-CoA dioxygenase family protein [Pirellulales bacterium]